MLYFHPLIENRNHSLEAFPILVERGASTCNVFDQFSVKSLVQVFVNFRCLEKVSFRPLGLWVFILGRLPLHPDAIALTFLLLKLLKIAKLEKEKYLDSHEQNRTC